MITAVMVEIVSDSKRLQDVWEVLRSHELASVDL
jgi:hypothetical protein